MLPDKGIKKAKVRIGFFTARWSYLAEVDPSRSVTKRSRKKTHL
jgi:hypothetical protein